jgi:SAM-dependent methyltransferase
VVAALASGAAIPELVLALVAAYFPLHSFECLGKSQIDILIAGCGTGQHAIETAQRFAGANVLAIDLSLGSLAYARRLSSSSKARSIDVASTVS